MFEADNPTVDEWRHHFKVLYADGGMLATGVTYAEFLAIRLQPEQPHEVLAHAAEIATVAKLKLPQTRDEMRILLEGESVALRNLANENQLVLL